MKRLLPSLLLVLIATVNAIDLSPSDQKPNVILVMADDQGWGDTAYNGHPFAQTPAMDAMAKEGFALDRFYAAAPVCSPTRASVLSGRNPVRCKVPQHGRYMRPHETTLAEALKPAGYTTGIFGKVHLGSGQPDSPCNPSGMGFDEWVIGLNFFDNDPYLSHAGKIKQHQGKGSVILMDEALGFLEKHKASPTFTVIWFPSPHDPFGETPDGPTLYEGEKMAGYYREITLLDQQLGRLRSSLRELGIADNTILWYCSDNGGLNQQTSGGRAKKGSVYEGGLRVPGIIEWPARKLKGRSSIPTMTSDIYPTILALTGTKLPTGQPPLDGTNIAPILEGKVDTRKKPIAFWHNFQGGQSTWSDRILADIMKKQQDGAPTPHNLERMAKDVMLFPQFDESYAKGHSALVDWPWKLHRINGKKYELYNLEADPLESSNLINKPDHSEQIAAMRSQLHNWMKSVVRSVNGADYPKN